MFKIYNEKTKNRFLKLSTNSKGNPAVEVVDENGKHIENSWLVEFLPNGKIHLCNGVSRKLGFHMGACDKVIVE